MEAEVTFDAMSGEEHFSVARQDEEEPVQCLEHKTCDLNKDRARTELSVSL